MSTMTSKSLQTPSTKRKSISDCEEMTPEDDGPEKKRCKTINNENLITVLVEDLKREQEKVLNLGKSVAAESSLKDLALKEVELLKVESGNYSRDVVNLQNQISMLKGVINQTEAEVSKLKIEIVNSQKEQKLVSSLKKQNLSEQKKCKELEQICSLAEEIFDEYQSDYMRFQSRMETVFRKDETTEQKERKVKKVLKGVRLRLDNKRGKTRRKRKCTQRRKPEDENMVEE
ncbi:hypothetical protein MKW92_026343 [Papaver armeniacum]|nr:hypothetical protein MKW92_026343 [Papaver armeniacum]